MIEDFHFKQHSSVAKLEKHPMNSFLTKATNNGGQVYLFLPLYGDICRKEETGKYQLTVCITKPVHVLIMQMRWILKWL